MNEYEPARLKGYVTASEAAEMMDVTRQAIHKKIRRGEFKTARIVGTTYVLKEWEVKQKAEERELAAV